MEARFPQSLGEEEASKQEILTLDGRDPALLGSPNSEVIDPGRSNKSHLTAQEKPSLTLGFVLLPVMQLETRKWQL